MEKRTHTFWPLCNEIQKFIPNSDTSKYLRIKRDVIWHKVSFFIGQQGKQKTQNQRMRE